jgi:hypothetical protein
MTSADTHSDLEDALERYQQMAKPPLKFDVKRCTWEDVLDERTRAQEEYFANGRGGENFVRRTFRKAGDLAPAVSPWLDLIPNNDKGLCVLNGGLRLIFNVRAGSNWETISLAPSPDLQ